MTNSSILRVNEIQKLDGSPVTIYTPVLMPEVFAQGTTSAEFFNIPSWATEIRVMFRAVSSSNLNNFRVQLGNSNGWLTSNYNSTSSKGDGQLSASQTNSFIILYPTLGDLLRGQMIISRMSDDNITTYVETGGFMRANGTSCNCYGDFNADNIPTIDRVRVTTSGASTFATGRIGVRYS